MVALNRDLVVTIDHGSGFESMNNSLFASNRPKKRKPFDIKGRGWDFSE